MTMKQQGRSRPGGRSRLGGRTTDDGRTAVVAVTAQVTVTHEMAQLQTETVTTQPDGAATGDAVLLRGGRGSHR